MNGNYNHPNHALSIENIEHIHRLREDVKDVRNKHVMTKTVVSKARNETGRADETARITDLHGGSGCEVNILAEQRILL